LDPPVIGKKEESLPIAGRYPRKFDRSADTAPELVLNVLRPIWNAVGAGIQDGVAEELVSLTVKLISA